MTLTLQDIPPAPPLRSRAKHEKYRVLAYVMMWDEIGAWALKENVTTNQGRQTVFRAGWKGLRLLMLCKCGFGMACLDTGGIEPCWIIISNKSEEHLKRVQDLELIEKVHDVVGIDEAPKWYR